MLSALCQNTIMPLEKRFLTSQQPVAKLPENDSPQTFSYTSSVYHGARAANIRSDASVKCRVISESRSAYTATGDGTNDLLRWKGISTVFEHWKLQDFAPGEGYAAAAQLESFDDTAWISVDVPGDVHTELIAAGRIADPFYDRNETACAWIEDREWWYRLNLDGPHEALQPGERLELVFEGLDTFVTIWLNGEELGSHRNMFREAVFDVTVLLRPGQQNTLALCFDRPLDHAGQLVDSRWSDWMGPRSAMRKAQFGYGWDWGPRLPTVGIWRPVSLRRLRSATITGVRFRTLEIDLAAPRALVAVTVEVERFAGSVPLSATVALRAPGEAVDAVPIAAQSTVLNGEGAALSTTIYLQLENPQLWWTHDLGDPSLYTLSIQLEQGDVILETSIREVGIRTLILDQSPDPEEPGTRFFRFVLNGTPDFCPRCELDPGGLIRWCDQV